MILEHLTNKYFSFVMLVYMMYVTYIIVYKITDYIIFFRRIFLEHLFHKQWLDEMSQFDPRKYNVVHSERD